MKFNYTVNHNGIYYAPGEEVPIEEVKKPVEIEKEPAVEEKAETASQHRRGRPRRE